MNNIWQIILTAFLKQLETHPDQVFALIKTIIDLFEKNPAALSAAVDLAKKNSQ